MSDARFSIIPGWIVTDPRLKGRDLQVLCLLGRHTSSKHGWCRRSQVKMAEELSLARSTVQASIDRLVEIGGVERRVVVSESGRDSAHWYRVVYDREVSSNAIAAWDADDEKEFGPIDDADSGSTPCRHVGTPAGISAPPADSGPAPPADSGPAPINDSTLTASDLPRERAQAREEGEEEESPKALERRFRQWWSKWPSFEDDDEHRTRNAWLALSPQQRRDCEEKTQIWLERVYGKNGLSRTKVKKSSTYLAQRMWERLPETVVQAATQATERYKLFSKEYQALCLAILLGPESPLPRMPSTLEAMVKAGGPVADRERKEHRRRHAWPKVNSLYADRRGALVPADIAASAEDFRSYHAASPTVVAWRAVYDEMGWPFPPVGSDGWICFPNMGGDSVEAALVALESFRERLSEVRGDEHAA
ncbi:hypothetical protein [Shinella zoogloeoides]|uniref:hypothetical protein n=1 Tax=Shinella zoogloeoides TaxID=352475 RepID=UPI00273F9711|nr:hypothetical protein [Shinella zoogloeoides]WLR92166.1 hypothetical protein Q9316_17120 [Shinella zoogloeoides]